MEPADESPLTDRERVRLERRDKRRRSRMVVDNAGVKRVAQALAERRQRSRTPPGDSAEKPPP